MNPKNRSVFTVQVLFGLNAIIWSGLGISSLIRLSGNESAPQIVLLVVALMMFGNAAALLFAAWWLGRQTRGGFWFALAVLTINILLTFTDQVGFFDLATVLLDFVILGILLYNRKRYFEFSPPSHESIKEAKNL